MRQSSLDLLSFLFILSGSIYWAQNFFLPVVI
jgi:hypothetical protein